MNGLISLASCLVSRSKGVIITEKESYSFRIGSDKVTIEFENNIETDKCSWKLQTNDDILEGKELSCLEAKKELRKALNDFIGEHEKTAKCNKCLFCNFTQD